MIFYHDFPKFVQPLWFFNLLKFVHLSWFSSHHSDFLIFKKSLTCATRAALPRFLCWALLSGMSQTRGHTENKKLVVKLHKKMIYLCFFLYKGVGRNTLQMALQSQQKDCHLKGPKSKEVKEVLTNFLQTSVVVVNVKNYCAYLY